MRRLTVLVICLLLAGCLSPKLEAGNEAGGIVGGVGDANTAQSFSVADAHCKGFGKAARVSNKNTWNNTITFDCVKP